MRFSVVATDYETGVPGSIKACSEDDNYEWAKYLICCDWNKGFYLNCRLP